MTATPARTARLLTTDDLAAMVGVKPRTVERWRAAGEGPPFMLFGRAIRYHPARVQAWMLAREQGTPSASRRGTPSKGTPSASRGTPRGR